MKIKKRIVDKVNSAFEKKMKLKEFLMKCTAVNICPVCGFDLLIPHLNYPVYRCRNKDCGYVVHLNTIKEQTIMEIFYYYRDKKNRRALYLSGDHADEQLLHSKTKAKGVAGRIVAALSS